MADLPHDLLRSVVIRARRETVFQYFTDSARFARWWGEGSQIDARPGGAVLIRYPNGVAARGTIVEIDAPRRIVFTYGYESGEPVPPGASLVSVTLVDDPGGTCVELRHAFSSADARDHHVQGWRYQLAVFANVVAAEQHAGVAELADRWFAAWAEADPARRDAILVECATEEVEFRDAHGCTRGRADLAAHIGGALAFMPGIRLTREGTPRSCQGTALVGFEVRTPDGSVRGHGTNVFDLSADGRISRCVGFWAGS